MGILLFMADFNKNSHPAELNSVGRLFLFVEEGLLHNLLAVDDVDTLDSLAYALTGEVVDALAVLASLNAADAGL